MPARRRISKVISGILFLLSVAGAGYAAASDEKAAAAVDEVFSDLTKPGSPGCALARSATSLSRSLKEADYALLVDGKSAAA